MVLFSLLALPAAAARPEAGHREGPRAELGWRAGLNVIWHYLNKLVMADGDNRSSLDPNG